MPRNRPRDLYFRAQRGTVFEASPSLVASGGGGAFSLPTSLTLPGTLTVSGQTTLDDTRINGPLLVTDTATFIGLLAGTTISAANLNSTTGVFTSVTATSATLSGALDTTSLSATNVQAYIATILTSITSFGYTLTTSPSFPNTVNSIGYTLPMISESMSSFASNPIILLSRSLRSTLSPSSRMPSGRYLFSAQINVVNTPGVVFSTSLEYLIEPVMGSAYYSNVYNTVINAGPAWAGGFCTTWPGGVPFTLEYPAAAGKVTLVLRIAAYNGTSAPFIANGSLTRIG